MGHDSNTQKDAQKEALDKAIMREMAPYFFHMIWPVSIVLIIAKIYGPLP